MINQMSVHTYILLFVVCIGKLQVHGGYLSTELNSSKTWLSASLVGSLSADTSKTLSRGQIMNCVAICFI